MNIVLAFALFTQTYVQVPMIDDHGVERHLFTQVCTPNGIQQTARVVIFNHGSPAGGQDERLKMTPIDCKSEAAQWILSRGFILVAPMRRGFGATGGTYDESPGACENPDYHNTGLQAAKDIQATVDFVSKIPKAENKNIVVLGNSAGGWSSIAYNSISHPKVSAIINMAGGRGGHAGPNQDQNCSPSRLIETVGIFGKTATTSMLWIYTENDSYFGPAISKGLYSEFSKSGGVADFHLLPPFGKDGHSLFSGADGSLIWGPLFDEYLSRN